jgi:hypothetical protein
MDCGQAVALHGAYACPIVSCTHGNSSRGLKKGFSNKAGVWLLPSFGLIAQTLLRPRGQQYNGGMKMFENYHVFETELAGKKLVIETGKVAQLANGSCLVRLGDTVVLATATASQKPRDGIDFFPLAVDYEERLYAVGKIPGSFLKREGRPSERAVLTAASSIAR